jgi:hypothetical protein
MVLKFFKPVLILLCVCDKCAPAMEVYYYVQKMDEVVSSSGTRLNNLEDEYKDIRVQIYQQSDDELFQQHNERHTLSGSISVTQDKDGDDSSQGGGWFRRLYGESG